MFLIPFSLFFAFIQKKILLVPPPIFFFLSFFYVSLCLVFFCIAPNIDIVLPYSFFSHNTEKYRKSFCYISRKTKTIAIVWRVITLENAMKKRSKDLIPKIKWSKEDLGRYCRIGLIEKYNIAIAILGTP